MIYFQQETFINRDKWGLAFARFWSSLLLKCPVCAQDRVFKNFFQLKETCSHCEARFERDKGSAILSAALTYFVVIILSLLIAWPVIAKYGLFEGISFVFIGIVTLLVFALYRPIKGVYLWMLWCFGFVYPDVSKVN